MRKIHVAGILIAVLLIAAVSLFEMRSSLAASHSTQPLATTINPQIQAAAQSDAGRVRLSDTPYAPYSYLISSGNLSAEAAMATAGFNISRSSESNGTLLITLLPNVGGGGVSMLLKPGEKLYFIETSLGDDSNNQEFAPSDDALVKTDLAGYVLGYYNV